VDLAAGRWLVTEIFRRDWGVVVRCLDPNCGRCARGSASYNPTCMSDVYVPIPENWRK
jgi:hypothetical protein